MSVDDLIAYFRGLDRFQAARALEKFKALPPRFIYKFQGPRSRSVRGIIEESNLWLSSRRAFNDPFDAAARLTFEGTPEAKFAYFYRLALQHGSSTSDALVFAHAQVTVGNVMVPQKDFDDYIDQAGIVCFATSHLGVRAHAARNILMWSHYGVNHTGVCFQFHVPRAPETFVQSLGVEYHDDFITINWVRRNEVEPLLSKA